MRLKLTCDRYFIGLTLPADLETQVSVWRDRFYPSSTQRHPPHLTVVPPFEWPSVEVDVSKVDRFAKDLPKIGLSLLGIGTIPGNEKIFCIRIAKSEQLVKLREDLLNLTQAEVRRGFEPHLSLAKIKTGDFGELENYFRKVDLRQSVPAEELVVFKGRLGATWEKWRTYHLPKI